jgi:hypothetical protein
MLLPFGRRLPDAPRAVPEDSVYPEVAKMPAENQKFFASFFQKRSACFLPSL